MITEFPNVDNFSNTINSGKFIPSSKRNPCPVCGGTSGKCRTNATELVLCMEHHEPLPGWRYTGETTDFLWGKFYPEGDRPAPYIPEYRPGTKKIIDAEQWDNAYRSILDRLILSDRDIQDFERRGLTPAEIATLSTVARSLSDGYLIPFPDVHERYVGGQKRMDKPSDGGRYRWYYPNWGWYLGTGEFIGSNGEPEKPLAVWKNGDPVWIIEGTGVKPIVASVRHGITAIGASGGQHYLSPQTLAYTLEKLGNPKTIVFCPDAGDIQNKHVSRRIRNNISLLQSMGMEVTIAWWGQFTKADPDIDEIPNLDGVKFLTPEEFWSYARPEFRPDSMLVKKPTFTDRLAAYQNAQKNIILDQSSTGSGKSHFDAGLKPADLGVKKIFYVTNDPYNPTIKGFDDWFHMMGRHGGLKTVANSDGSTRLVRCKPGEPYTVEPNCVRSEAVEFLRNANVNGSDSAGVICGTCPMREKCAHSMGGVDFLAQRRRGLSADRVVCHPESLPDPKEFNYSEVAIIWDDTIPRALRHVQVSQNDVARTMAECLEVAKDLVKLYKAMGESLPRYGLDTEQVLSLTRIDLDPEYLETLTAPDLGKALNPVADQGVDLSDLPTDQRRFYSSDVTEGVKKISKQWLADYARVCQGLPGASMDLSNKGVLTITIPDHRFRNIVRAASKNIFQDATTSESDLALNLGVAPEDIAAMKQAQPPADNLEQIQISDIGAVTRNWGKDQKRRVEAIIDEFSSQGKTATIGFKGDFENYWHRDNRGSNNFLEIENLILVGTPYLNLSAALAEYSAMLGERVGKSDDGFNVWYRERTRAEIIQGVGRLRANRRAGTMLRVILISDFDMGGGWRQVRSEDITPLAGRKTAINLQGMIDHGVKMLRQGIEVTQQKLAEQVNISQSRVSQLVKEVQGGWKGFLELLILLLDTNSEINNFPPDPDPDITQTLYEGLAASPPGEILSGLVEIWQYISIAKVRDILKIASKEYRNQWRAIVIDFLQESPTLTTEPITPLLLQS